MTIIQQGRRYLARVTNESDRALNPSAAYRLGALETVWSWQVDLAGTFVYCGPNSMDVLGYRAEELVGGPAGRVMDISDLERQQSFHARTGNLVDGRSALAMQVRHRNGAHMWFEVTSGALRKPGGDVIGLQGSSRPLVIDSQRILADQVVRRRIEETLDLELLTTVFQPIVRLTDGMVVAVEALSRFSVEPTRTPDLWFSDAATVGLGVELELLAVRQALTAATALPGHLTVSINVSPEACLDPRLTDLIRQGPVDLRRVIIELTEHSPVLDYRSLDESLCELRKQGVRIAVDDVGAGYSSLQHILQLKPSVIKLDRQVVANLDVDQGRQALGAAIVFFADRIGARVIAEGIETTAELQMAQHLGMSGVQGYLLGRPTADPAEWSRWDTAVEILSTTNDPTGPRLDLSPLTAGPGHGIRRQYERNSNFLNVAADVFDALPDPTVVLDRSGFITATNQAWRTFGAQNGGDPETSGVGIN